MVALRPSWYYQGLISLLSAVLVATLTSSLSGFWRMQVPREAIAVIALGAALFALVAWRAPWAAAGLCVAALVGGVAATGYSPQWTALLVSAGSEGSQFLQRVRVFELDATFGPTLGHVFLGAVALCMALIAVLEAMTEGTTFWTLAIGTVIFATEWVWYYDQSATAFILYACTGFALWVLAQAARRDAGWLKSGRKVGYRSHVASPVVWVILLSLLAYALPSEFSPVSLGSLGQRLQAAVPILKQLRGGEGGIGRFSLRSTGFSPAIGLLGGPISPDDSIALQVALDEPLVTTAYLRGVTFATYNGNTWLPGASNMVNFPKGGALPTTYSGDVPLTSMKLTITPVISLGNTLFSLLEPERVEGLRGNYTADVDGNLWADRAVFRGGSYDVSVRWPQYNQEQIRLLSTSPPGSTYKPYQQLPGSLPLRVGLLTRSIVAGKTHPLDKALAVEAYLRSMRYDLNVPSAPPGRDFVDYFLYDLQKGYCVYYATAMAVMLRELDIPSRLVEGFALPPVPIAPSAQGKYVYTVRNSQAHAWVEAYFPGYGWVTFDPTPRRDVPLIDRNAFLPASSQIGTENGGTPEDPLNPDDPEGSERNNPRVEEDGGTEDGASALENPWPWVLAGLAGIAVLGALGFRHVRRQDRIGAAGGRQVVQEVWEKSGTLLGRFDFGRKPGETPVEYARAVGRAWPSLEEPLAEAAADYTSARYAAPVHPVDAAAPGRARRLWARIRTTLLERYGWRLYLWRRLKWAKERADR